MMFIKVFFKFALILLFIFHTNLSQSNSLIIGGAYINTSNLPSAISQEFSLKKVSTIQDINVLPEEFHGLIIETNKYDYYYVISPTKGSGGYNFELEEYKKSYKICLRAPKPMSAVTTALTTPIALVRVQRGVKVDPTVTECK